MNFLNVQILMNVWMDAALNFMLIVKTHKALTFAAVLLDGMGIPMLGVVVSISDLSNVEDLNSTYFCFLKSIVVIVELLLF